MSDLHDFNVRWCTWSFDVFSIYVHVGCLYVGCVGYLYVSCTCRMSLRCVYMSDVFMIAVDQCLDIISCMGWMFFHFNVLFNDDFRIRDNDHWFAFDKICLPNFFASFSNKFHIFFMAFAWILHTKYLRKYINLQPFPFFGSMQLRPDVIKHQKRIFTHWFHYVSK